MLDSEPNVKSSSRTTGYEVPTQMHTMQGQMSDPGGPAGPTISVSWSISSPSAASPPASTTPQVTVAQLNISDDPWQSSQSQVRDSVLKDQMEKGKWLYSLLIYPQVVQAPQGQLSPQVMSNSVNPMQQMPPSPIQLVQFLLNTSYNLKFCMW